MPSWCLYREQQQPVAFVASYFSVDECQEIIETCKTFPLRQGLVGLDATLDDATRITNVAFVPPVQQMTHIYEKLTDAVFLLNDRNWNFDLFSFNEHLQFTEYNVGGKYDQHVDTYYGGAIRKLSVIVQLSDTNSYSGGDVEIFLDKTPKPLPKMQGTVIAFPSYVMHRVTPVTHGTRHSLVGWVTGNPFK